MEDFDSDYRRKGEIRIFFGYSMMNIIYDSEADSYYQYSLYGSFASISELIKVAEGITTEFKNLIGKFF